MPDFLLELRSEEIPARMQAKARTDLARLFAEEVAKSGLAAAAIETFSTPRRLALLGSDLPPDTPPVSEERKGPRTTAPEAALAGFLRSTGLTREQLVERDGTYFATIEKPRRPTAQVLAEVIPAIVRAFTWPKSMRWGAASSSTESLRWVRPLHGIVALFGDDIVPIDIDGIASGATTLGHRFHHPGPITIGSATDYVEELRACQVIVDQSEREALIRDGAAKLAAEAGLTLVEDDGLVVENAGLTEWPVPLLGRFDPAFLDVPPEVIALTARTNQKYFVCTDAAGILAPAFICTANIAASDGGQSIVAGNERVLAARLADARFFWEQDLKVPLEVQAAKLQNIVFHEKLGTVADKVERVAKLARWLVEEGIIVDKPLPFRGGVGVGTVRDNSTSMRGNMPHPNPSPEGEGLADLAERAARLCKADLVTGMVGEFPELQGIIGGHLALAQGEDPRVADAIRDHYKPVPSKVEGPVGQGDEVPTAPVTVAVSLADKLDTIAVFFGRDLLPTGSKDPFALRRTALSLIELIFENRCRITVRELVKRQLLEFAEQLRPDTTDILRVRRNDSGEDLPTVGIMTDRHGKSGALIQSGEEYLEIPLPDKEGQIYSDRVELVLNLDRVAPVIWLFLVDRLKVQQREAGVRHDLIDAVFALGGEDDLVRLLARVKALQAFVETPDGANLLAGYKRAANILKKEGSLARHAVAPAQVGAHLALQSQSAVDDERRIGPGLRRDDGEERASETPSKKPLSHTPEIAETALIDALDAAEPLAAAALEREDFDGAMAVLASLRVPIDAFFESVTVNDADPVKRAARLALLGRVRDAVHRVADFSKIEG